MDSAAHSCLLPPFDPQGPSTRRTSPAPPSRAGSPDSDKENDVRAVRKPKRSGGLGKVISPMQPAGVAIFMRKEAGLSTSSNNSNGSSSSTSTSTSNNNNHLHAFPLRPRRLEYNTDGDVDMLNVGSPSPSTPRRQGSSARRVPFAELPSPSASSMRDDEMMMSPPPPAGLLPSPFPRDSESAYIYASPPAMSPSSLKSPYRRSPLARTTVTTTAAAPMRRPRMSLSSGRPEGVGSRLAAVPFALYPSAHDARGELDENTAPPRVRAISFAAALGPYHLAP